MSRYVLGTKGNIRGYKSNSVEPVILPIVRKMNMSYIFVLEKY